MTNETDRELLELAGKAHGLVGEYEGYMWLNGSRWNPLTDDGDALRLAVKLGMVLDFRYTNPESMKFNRVNYWPKGRCDQPWESINFDVDIDPYAATRRAIVRAAAEVGKGILTQEEFILMFPGRFDEETVEAAKAEIGRACHE